MVDADAVVLLPRAGLVVPKCVEAGSVGGRAQRVGHAKRQELAEFRARLRQKQRVVDPLLRASGVALVRDHVEIASQDQRLLVFEQLAGMDDQALQERELIGVFVGVRRIAVRQIDARDPDYAASRRHDRFDIARLGVVLVTGEAPRDLERPLGKYRDAVERLLPMGLDVVAELLDLEPWKLLVEALDLLQAKNVGLNLLQIGEEVRQALADRIDVPGGDAQARGSLNLWRRAPGTLAAPRGGRAEPRLAVNSVADGVSRAPKGVRKNARLNLLWSASTRLILDRLIGQRAQIELRQIEAHHRLGEEQADQLFLRIDPVMGLGCAGPAEFAD